MKREVRFKSGAIPVAVNSFSQKKKLSARNENSEYDCLFFPGSCFLTIAESSYHCPARRNGKVVQQLSKPEDLPGSIIKIQLSGERPGD
jgi:hypothetical protein